MKRCATWLTLLCLLFLLLSLLPAGKGVGGVLCAQLRFLLPALLALLPCVRGDREVRGPYLTPRVAGAPFLLLPFLIVGTMLLAAVCGFLCEKWGIGVATSLPEGKSLLYLLAVYALLPAIGEELLCRYAMLRLLLPYSRKAGLFLSALLFACLHMNAGQFAYALFAGVILGWVTIATDSIATAMLFHFTNNALSVLLFYFSDLPYLPPLLYGGVAVAAVLCALLLIALRRRPGVRALGEAVGRDEACAAALRGALFSPLPLFVVLSFLIML